MFNTKAANGLATQGARASASNITIYYDQEKWTLLIDV